MMLHLYQTIQARYRSKKQLRGWLQESSCGSEEKKGLFPRKGSSGLPQKGVRLRGKKVAYYAGNTRPADGRERTAAPSRKRKRPALMKGKGGVLREKKVQEKVPLASRGRGGGIFSAEKGGGGNDNHPLKRGSFYSKGLLFCASEKKEGAPSSEKGTRVPF